MPNGESDRYEGVEVAGYENQYGEFFNTEHGNAPSDYDLENANRVIIAIDELKDGEPTGERNYYTVGALTDDYTLDDAVDDIEVSYGAHED